MSFDEFEKQLDDMEKHVKNEFQEPTKASADADAENAQDESDGDDNEFYCVACNKSFKSEKA